MNDSWNQEAPLVPSIGEAQLLEIAFSLSVNDEALIVGNGDDAAVIKAHETSLTTTVDAQIEGVHFRRDWLSPKECGRRAFRVSASDVMAMGLKPQWALLSLGLPDNLSLQSYRALMTGFAEGCKEVGATLVGGNLTRNEVLSLHITVLANPEEHLEVWPRSSAQLGDILWITGSPGDAAAGLALLGRPDVEPEDFQRLIDAWKSPDTHWHLLDRLRQENCVHACIDLSDGLLIDARRMASASNQRFVFDTELLPKSEQLLEAAHRMEQPPFQWVLGGGESYQLLIAADKMPPQWALDAGIRPIGRVEPGNSDVVVLDNKRPMDLSLFSEGWDPF